MTYRTYIWHQGSRPQSTTLLCCCVQMLQGITDETKVGVPLTKPLSSKKMVLSLPVFWWRNKMAWMLAYLSEDWFTSYVIPTMRVLLSHSREHPALFLPIQHHMTYSTYGTRCNFATKLKSFEAFPSANVKHNDFKWNSHCWKRYTIKETIIIPFM